MKINLKPCREYKNYIKFSHYVQQNQSCKCAMGNKCCLFSLFFKYARFHFLSMSLKKCSVSVEQKSFLKEVAIGLLKKLMNHFMNHEASLYKCKHAYDLFTAWTNCPVETMFCRISSVSGRA